MKQILGIYSAPDRHWVGNGFPVRSMFTYDSHAEQLSPFLLLDHAGPTDFRPGNYRRGVGAHPHRGFETVTIVYDGEVAHRDSTGAGGLIGPGDVQWMTAGSGIVHEEFHSESFTQRGGRLEMVQLWVNLPAEHKMTPPGYQTLMKADIPDVALPDGAGTVRVIAGAYDGQAGPARTFSPLDVWDLRLQRNGLVRLPVADGRTLALVVLRGTVEVNGVEVVREGQLVVLDRKGSDVQVEANNEATLLLLSGEPLDEPVVGYGPFVMTSERDIQQAISDYRSGRFGEVVPVAG